MIVSPKLMVAIVGLLTVLAEIETYRILATVAIVLKVVTVFCAILLRFQGVIETTKTANGTTKRFTISEAFIQWDVSWIEHAVHFGWKCTNLARVNRLNPLAKIVSREKNTDLLQLFYDKAGLTKDMITQWSKVITKIKTPSVELKLNAMAIAVIYGENNDIFQWLYDKEADREASKYFS